MLKAPRTNLVQNCKRETLSKKRKGWFLLGLPRDATGMERVQMDCGTEGTEAMETRIWNCMMQDQGKIP